MHHGEREGVIKFGYELERRPVAAPCLAELAAWREILCRLALVGCDERRYEGLGFGNVSHRLGGRSAGASPRFLISGSQTGALARLEPEHWVEIFDVQPEASSLRARGLWPPSAEAMTHAAVYAQDRRIRCVLHGHSPEIFAAAARLGLPSTAAEVPYGTPEMAAEVGRLFRAGEVGRQGFFVMGGHQDGVIAFGRSAAEAGRRMVLTLARALA